MMAAAFSDAVSPTAFHRQCIASTKVAVAMLGSNGWSPTGLQFDLLTGGAAVQHHGTMAKACTDAINTPEGACQSLLS